MSIHLLSFLFYRRNNLSAFIFSSQSCLTNHQSFMPFPSRFVFLLKTNKPGLCELFCCFWRLQAKKTGSRPQVRPHQAVLGGRISAPSSLINLSLSLSQLHKPGDLCQPWGHHQLQPPSAEPSPTQYLGCLFFSLRVQLRACPLPNCLLFPPGGFSKLSRFWILTLFSRKFSALLTSVSFASVMRFHSRNIPTVHHFWGGPLRTVCLWHWALQQPMPGISPGRNPRATTQCAGWGRWGYRANMLCLQWAVAFCHSTITKIIQISCLAAIQPSMREKTHR